MYLEFAWVYWRRQRVKLRSGGILDHDDWVTDGFLLKWVFGSRDGEGVSKGTTGGSWRDWVRNRFGTSPGVQRGGRGGISVCADEDGVGGILARGSRGGRYNDEEEGGAGTAHKGARARGEEEGRVLVGEDSDEEENNDTTVWQQGREASEDEEGIVLAGSDDDEDFNDESRMTRNT